MLSATHTEIHFTVTLGCNEALGLLLSKAPTDVWPVIVDMDPEGQASRVGMRVGDEIRSLDSQLLTDFNECELQQWIGSRQRSDPVAVTCMVWRAT